MAKNNRNKNTGKNKTTPQNKENKIFPFNVQLGGTLSLESESNENKINLSTQLGLNDADKNEDVKEENQGQSENFQNVDSHMSENGNEEKSTHNQESSELNENQDELKNETSVQPISTQEEQANEDMLKVSSLNERIKELEHKLAKQEKLCRTLSDVNTEKDALHSQNLDLNFKLKEEELLSQINDLKKINEEKEKFNENENSEIRKLNFEKKNLIEEIFILKNIENEKFINSQIELTDEIHKLKLKIKHFEEDRVNANKRFEENKILISKLQKENEELHVQNKLNSNHLSTLTVENKKLKEENDNQLIQLKENATSIRELENAKQNLLKDISVCDIELSELKETLHVKEQTIIELDFKLKDLIEKSRDYETNLRMFVQVVAETKVENNKTILKNQQLEAQNNDYSNKNSELSKKNFDLEEKLNLLNQSSKQVAEEIKDQNETLDCLKAEIENKNQTINEFNKKQNHDEMIIDSLKAEIKDFKSQNDALRNEKSQFESERFILINEKHQSKERIKILDERIESLFTINSKLKTEATIQNEAKNNLEYKVFEQSNKLEKQEKEIHHLSKQNKIQKEKMKSLNDQIKTENEEKFVKMNSLNETVLRLKMVLNKYVAEDNFHCETDDEERIRNDSILSDVQNEDQFQSKI